MLYYVIVITSFPFKPSGSISYNNIATVNIEINYIIHCIVLNYVTEHYPVNSQLYVMIK